MNIEYWRLVPGAQPETGLFLPDQAVLADVEVVPRRKCPTRRHAPSC